jgi:hypothetical protein
MVSRGDRRLAPFLERFTILGGTHGHVNRAFKSLEQDDIMLPNAAWYGERERPEHETFAWDLLAHQVPKPILWKEAQIPAALQVKAF